MEGGKGRGKEDDRVGKRKNQRRWRERRRRQRK